MVVQNSRSMGFNRFQQPSMSHQHFPKLILLSATIQSLSAGSQCPLHQQSPHRMPAPRGLLNLATIVFVTGEKSHVWWRHACYNWWSMIHGWTCSWNVHEQIMVRTWMDMDGHVHGKIGFNNCAGRKKPPLTPSPSTSRARSKAFSQASGVETAHDVPIHNLSNAEVETDSKCKP